MNTPERLQAYLTEYNRRYPAAWRQYDEFRAGRGKDLPRWPEWCYCPMAAAYAIAIGEDRVHSSGQLRDIGILAALAAWRLTKGIYRYDPDMFAALRDTTLEGDLPAGILYHLPEWCVYIEAPANACSWGDWPILGWFAHLEWDAEKGRPELRFVIDTQDRLIPIPIHLTRSTLEECARDALEEGCAQAAKLGINLDLETCLDRAAAPLTPLVSITLYLCSVAADIADRRGRRERPGNPQAVKTKRGMRIFPASNATEWDVGYRIGASLRLARHEPSEPGDGHHASPRPHIRRAHWHSYWTGPRAGERRIVLKWLPPIPIGAGEIVPTIHEVD
jgi:hypothetical protein